MSEHELAKAFSHFDTHEVASALHEALAEHEREPRTDVWKSFWDRLMDGEQPPSHDWVEYTPGHRDTPIHMCGREGCEATREIPKWG